MHLRPICALIALTVTTGALTTGATHARETDEQSTPAVVISDPPGDVAGDAANAETIDVYRVRYRLKTSRDVPFFSVRLRYRKILPAKVGRQSFVTKIRAGGRAYALVMHANGYDSMAEIYRVTGEGWKETNATVEYALNTFSGKGLLQAQVRATFFRSGSIDRVQTTLRLRDHGGRAVDRTRAHRTPISLVP